MEPERATNRQASEAERAKAASLARAEARLKELRGTYQLLDIDEFRDKFKTPDAPPGWSYEWKRWTCVGAEDPAYQVGLAQNGWTPVPLARHPEMMPKGWTAEHIMVEGLILMERPEILTIEQREREDRMAANAVRTKEKQLGLAPQGHFGRLRGRTGVTKSHFDGPSIRDE